MGYYRYKYAANHQISCLRHKAQDTLETFALVAGKGKLLSCKLELEDASCVDERLIAVKL